MPNHASDADRTPARRVRRVALLWAIPATAALGAGALVLAGAGADPPRREVSQPRTADLVPVTRSSFDITTTCTGELGARNQIEIRSKLDTQSTIVEIVPEGVRVKAGDVLVRLNGDAIQTQIDEELARVESSRAELVAAVNAYEIQENENDSALRQAKLNLELAELTLLQWENGELVTSQTKNKLAIDEAEREYKRLKEKYERSVVLESQGFLSRDQLQQDELAMLKADAARVTAHLAHKSYEDYQRQKDEKSRRSDVEEAKAELERVGRKNEIQLASKDADRINRRRQLQIREDRLAKLQAQLEACTIVAPTDGLVVYSTSLNRDNSFRIGGEGPLQIGSTVRPNEAILVLPDTSQMIANVRVHESLAGRVRPGQHATVKIDAAGGRTYIGRVESIGVLAESGGWRDPNLREYTVKIALDADNTAGDLKPSMRCEAQLHLGRVEDVLTAPVQAVFNDGAVRFVYVPRGAKFVKVPVRLGRRSSTLAEIVAGVNEGDLVLIRDPQPGEVLDSPWTPEQLAAVGLAIGPDGKPVASGGAEMPQMLARPGTNGAELVAPPGSAGPPAADGSAAGPGGAGDGANARRFRREGAPGDAPRGERPRPQGLPADGGTSDAAPSQGTPPAPQGTR